MKFSNNIKSKYLILNIKFKKTDIKYTLIELKNILKPTVMGRISRVQM